MPQEGADVPTTLTYGGTTLNLPDDALWPDEFAWQPIQATNTYSVGGALIVNRGLKLAGRPITLRCEWITRSLALALQAWAWLPDAPMSLSYRGTTYSVRFDHSQQPLEVTPVIEYSDPAADDYVDATLRLLTV